MVRDIDNSRAHYPLPINQCNEEGGACHHVRHDALLVVHPAPEAVQLVLHELALHTGVVIGEQTAPAVPLAILPGTRVALGKE